MADTLTDKDLAMRSRMLREQCVIPEPPPATIPTPDPKVPFFALAYLFNRSICNLWDSRFDIFLPDYPKAVLFKSKAERIAADAKFYYCHEGVFGRDWAFAKAPEDNFFLPHPVWSRVPANAWQLVTSSASMAKPQ